MEHTDLLVMKGKGDEPSLYIFDNFHSEAGVEIMLQFHTADTGESWEAIEETIYVVHPSTGDKIYGAGTWPCAVVEAGLSDVRIKIQGEMLTPTKATGISFRVADIDNRLQLDYYNFNLRLLKKEAGAYLELGTLPGGQGDYHEIEIRLIGSLIEVWLNDVFMYSVIESFNLTETKHGVVFLIGQISTTIETFRITTKDDAAEPIPTPTLEYLMDEGGGTVLNDNFSGNTANIVANASITSFEGRGVLKSLGTGDGATMTDQAVYLTNGVPFTIQLRFYLDSYSTTYPGILSLKTGVALAPFSIFCSLAGSYYGLSFGTPGGTWPRLRGDVGDISGQWNDIIITYSGGVHTDPGSWRVMHQGVPRRVYAAGNFANGVDESSLGSLAGTGGEMKTDLFRIWSGYAISPAQAKVLQA